MFFKETIRLILVVGKNKSFFTPSKILNERRIGSHFSNFIDRYRKSLFQQWDVQEFRLEVKFEAEKICV